MQDQEERVNILPCCGGHEDHLDDCPKTWPPEWCEDPGDEGPWAPAFL